MKKFKKIVSVIISLQFVCASVGTVFANSENLFLVHNDVMENSESEEEHSNKEQRIIVKFKDKDKKEEFSNKKSKKIRNKIKGENIVSLGDGEYSILSLDSEATAEDFISDVESVYNEDIEFIQPDYEISVLAEEENTMNIPAEEQGMIDSNIEFPEISGTDVNETIVAVIDTGIDLYHPAYTDKIVVNSNETMNGEDSDGNGYIDDVYGWDFINNTDLSDVQPDSNHGTHITGLITGNEIGVGANAKILPLKVFENGTAYTSDIINAIEYAQNRGARIVNCSWGTTSENPALEEAVRNSNMLFVCAAGNSSVNTLENPVYPASYDLDNIISVGAVNDRDYLTYFSNYGDNVDLTANGYNVYSAFVNNNFGQMTGTSMSAAYVTGVAAAIYSDNAYCTKQQLLDSCDRISTLVNHIDGGRRINYNNAINAVTVTEIQENTNIDYITEHENEIINSSSNFELYDLDPEPIKIEAGQNHSLVMNNFGDVLSYGDNTYKQLGKKYDGTVQFMNNTIQGLGSVEKVSSFANHSLALDNQGRVYAWGQNNRYQLGNTTGISNEIPTQVEFFNTDGTAPVIVDIAAGGWFSMALDSDGKLWVWGDNTYGQLATGYTGSCLSTPRIIMNGVSKISAGKYHALAVKDNTVYGWGRNAEDYPLGENASWSQSLPIEITGLPGTILDVEAGDRCSFFMTSGGVYAMGLNNSGQLGDGTTTTRSTPVLLEIAATQIQSNGSTLFNSDGTVYTCGPNTLGQLGQGYENTRIETPIKVPGNGYKQIAAGGSHNLLFKCNEEYGYDEYYYRNATIYAMGCNDSGQCLLSSSGHITYPTIVEQIENTEDTGDFKWNDTNLRPIDSTYVSQNNNSTNYYGQSLRVNYTKNESSDSGYGEYAYLKFDVSNIYKDRIASATLHLYVENNGDIRESTREIGIFDTYTNNWDGQTMTWNDERARMRSLLGTFTVSANGHMFDEEDLGWHDIDITDYLKNDCIDDELSLALKMVSTQAHEIVINSGIYNESFNSNDMHINRNIPVLEITYKPEEDVNTIRTSYTVSSDTYINQRKPENDMNFSNSELLGINYTPDESRNDYWGQDSYLSFDIGLNEKEKESIRSASLWLYVDENSDNRNSVRTIDISGNYGLQNNSSTMTWTTGRPNGQYEVGSFTVAANGYEVITPGWKQIDITEFIKNNPQSKVEFILKMGSDTQHPVKIRSSEYNDESTRPRIVIDSNKYLFFFDFEDESLSGWKFWKSFKNNICGLEEGAGRNDSVAAYIKNIEGDDTSLDYQFTSLNPDKIYICEAWLKGDNIQAGAQNRYNIGANISTPGLACSKIGRLGTFDWEKHIFVFKPNKDGRFNLRLRLGFVSCTPTGKVYFDNVLIREFDEVQSDSQHIRLSAWTDSNRNDDGTEILTQAELDEYTQQLSQVYKSYEELTGYTPYGGRKVDILMTNTHTYGALAGNPIEYNTKFAKDAFISRHQNNDDMQFSILHEMGHVFDYDVWNFNMELMANFKMTYVLEDLNMTVIAGGIVRCGAEIKDYYKKYYDNYYALGDYSNPDAFHDGLTYKLLDIKDKIGGWDSFKQAFRYIQTIPPRSMSNYEKFEMFIDTLSEYNNKKINVRDLFNDVEWQATVEFFNLKSTSSSMQLWEYNDETYPCPPFPICDSIERLRP